MAVKYDNATKQTWRGWAWNQVAKKLLPGQRVMVLCGDGSHDIDVGARKGFEVVGVDILQGSVDRFRGKGGIAVCDTIEKQVYAVNPDAVIFDYMGGITPHRLRTVADATRFCNVVVANFLRGRDPAARQIAGDLRPLVRDGEKHRGKIAAAFVGCDLMRVLFENMDSLDDERYLFLSDIQEGVKNGRAREAAEFARGAIAIHNPAFYSYRSKDGKQYFDSVSMSLDGDIVESVKPTVWCHDRRSVRLAAAAKAVSTMRREMN